MFKLPIKTKCQIYITQYYGNTSNSEWYRLHGIDLPKGHNGVDIICGTDLITYGTPLVCPFVKAQVVKKTFDSPMSTKGNGVTLKAVIGKDTFELVLWHSGEIRSMLGEELVEGDVVSFIGNSGLCNPAPTTSKPYAGAHLHLMLYVNGILVDPLLYFDKTQWYLGEDSGPLHDIEPLKWRWAQLGTVDWWMKLIDACVFWR